MNVVDIHKMLNQIWPNGIKPEAYSVIAGMMVLNNRMPHDGSLLSHHFVAGLSRGLAPPKPYFKLDQEKATEIRAALAKGETQASIARRYGASESLISRIKSNEIWKVAPAPAPVLRSSLLSRQAPEKLVWAIKALLETQNKKARTQKEIAKTLKLGPWTVKRALWQLVRDGLVNHKKPPQGPHLYKAV